MNINQNMREFSNDLEEKFTRAFNSDAGKKFGLAWGKESIKKHPKGGKSKIDDIENQATNFLQSIANTQFAPRTVANSDLPSKSNNHLAYSHQPQNPYDSPTSKMTGMLGIKDKKRSTALSSRVQSAYMKRRRII
jgi:hypothetical protein